MSLLTIEKDYSLQLEISNSSSSIDVGISDGSNFSIIDGQSFTLGITEPSSNTVSVQSTELFVTISNNESSNLSIQTQDNSFEYSLNTIAGKDGIQGIQGEVGPRGFGGGSEDFIAGSVVLAYKLVAVNTLGQVIYATNDAMPYMNRLIGMTLNSGQIGDTITVQLYGSVLNTEWNFVPNQSLFLGADGDITTDWNAGMYSQFIGFAKSSTEIFLNIGKVVVRG